MPDVPALYAGVQHRITELVSALDEGTAASTKVPPCPDWSVKDLLGHLAGVCNDIVNGRLDGVATDEWTQRQVDERKDRSLAEVLDEWREFGPKAAEAVVPFGEAGVQLLADATAHEHDVRCALKSPGERDGETIAVSLRWLTGQISAGGFEPAFTLLTPEGDEIVVGAGEPKGVLKAGRFDAYRALTGRRSEGQVASFDWDGDYKDFAGAFNRGPFKLASSDIDE